MYLLAVEYDLTLNLSMEERQLARKVQSHLYALPPIFLASHSPSDNKLYHI